MDSSKALKYNLRTFTFVGLWPLKSLRYPFLYNFWAVIVWLILGILYPCTLILSLFFADSIYEMAEHLVLTSSVVVLVIKAINLLLNRKELRQLFGQLEELDGDIREEPHVAQMQALILMSHRLYFSFLCPYIFTCVLLVFQAIFSSPETRMWSSTYSYPFDWAHFTYIYVSGIFFQGICNFFIVFFAVAADTYGVILIYILVAHIDILHRRLERLGKCYHKAGSEPYGDLIYCCKAYEKILG